VPLRGPLLAALDVEYAHASKAKNLERMDEISKVVEILNKVWPEIASPAPSAPPASPAPPALVIVPDPNPEPQPAIEEEAPLPPVPYAQEGLSLRDILHRADPRPPVATGNGQGDRRREARAAVKDAVADVNRRTDGDQFRYELALMVANENVEAMSDMQAAAIAEGLPVRSYAQRIIAQHNARRRRAAQVYAIEAQALKDIDTATGDAINAIAARAVNEIRGDDA
jgi:hypothetical protein